MRRKLVVIGNGMAGVRCVEEILKHNPELYNISIIGSEPHHNYNRILLSSVLQGEARFQDITINDAKWYEENDITLFSGETATEINTEKKVVVTDKNHALSYDKLIVATGSSPFVLPIPGVEKEGVVTFRTIEDCKNILETAKQYKNAVVIGGGVLGLEAARGLVNLGLNVKVVHNTEYLMQRQLDSVSSEMLQHQLERQGIEFLLGKVTEQIRGDKRVNAITFTDGTSVDADLVVMSVGIIPNTVLAKKSGIRTNRGIVVNDFMETSVSDIYAVGECVEHKGIVYGLVKPLYEQGQVLAKHLCQLNPQGYEGSVLSTSLKVPGVELFSVGDFTEDSSTKSLTMLNEIHSVYKKIIFRGDIIAGAVLYGETKNQSKLLDFIVKRKHVSDEEKRQLLQSADKDSSSFKSMKQSEMICNCNGVTKGTIIEAVQQNELTTVQEVKQCTKASSSCGGCKLLLSDLLDYIQSDECDELFERESLCACTTLTEDEVVLQIQQKNLSSLQDVFTQLNWLSLEGCADCVSAIQYYLAMIYPDHAGKNQFFYMNDNLKAQHMSDGTYSIIPQTFGGKVSAEQLRNIAAVMEKYQLTDVGLTTEQRFQLKGIMQEDIGAVCKDLGIRLRPVNIHTIHHVNTYYSEKNCQCHTEASLQLSILLEKELELILTPHEIKLSVSPCKHNDLEMRTNDIHVVGVERGWEMYVGGSYSPDLQQGELFSIASDHDEAKRLICGFVQYYRETANYLEKISEWRNRVGIIHIREVLFEETLCNQLVERLEVEMMPTVEKI
ncbi:nitrite reductase large subunit NirB [Metabacillus endolithicus]|uniref:Nitrite reductase large subunit NirB n=1 Tax=Metabacillus endolithicus TaxID=1535204 RepID=A0ABW5C0Q4_9BACI|nr:nitrite reductase large subunit NirB [Metabacillus endolithicus]UPG65754.1 nitrite reductase large subunit NirB [Metabacillus endolithicus]